MDELRFEDHLDIAGGIGCFAAWATGWPAEVAVELLYMEADKVIKHMTSGSRVGPVMLIEHKHPNRKMRRAAARRSR